MTNEKKIWLLEQYAHKAWTVSLVLTQEAAKAGEYGEGYAMVAHEARVLVDKLFEYTEKALFYGKNAETLRGVSDFARTMKLLSVNSELEAMRMADISMDFNIPKSMAVFADELRRIAASLEELAGGNIREKPFTLLEFTEYPEPPVYDFYFKFSIGGFQCVEKCGNVSEVFCLTKADIDSGTVSLRGENIPVIDCFSRFGLDRVDSNGRQTVIIIRPDNMEKAFAAPVDELDTDVIFYSPAGKSVPLEKGHIPDGFARDCWDAAGGGQYVFIDWGKLI
jgi:hypothetical protein